MVRQALAFRSTCPESSANFALPSGQRFLTTTCRLGTSVDTKVEPEGTWP
jgi:hypothetical protein